MNRGKKFDGCRIHACKIEMYILYLNLITGSISIHNESTAKLL